MASRQEEQHPLERQKRRCPSSAPPRRHRISLPEDEIIEVDGSIQQCYDWWYSYYMAALEEGYTVGPGEIHFDNSSGLLYYIPNAIRQSENHGLFQGYNEQLDDYSYALGYAESGVTSGIPYGGVMEPTYSNYDGREMVDQELVATVVTQQSGSRLEHRSEQLQRRPVVIRDPETRKDITSDVLLSSNVNESTQ